jgi:hypothetical protein
VKEKRKSIAMEEKIEILGDDNYEQWAFAMKGWFVIKNLWKPVLVKEGQTKPADFETIGGEVAADTTRRREQYQAGLTVYEEWEDLDEKVFSYIALNINRDNANLLHGLSSGKEAWNLLKDYHMQVSIGSKIRATTKLYETKLEKEKHLNDMQAMFNKLHDMGEPIKESNKISVILASVGSEYNAVTTAIGAWEGTRAGSMAAVREYLMDEYEKKKKERVKATSVRRDSSKLSQHVEANSGNWNAIKQWGPSDSCHNCSRKARLSRLVSC